MAFVDDFTAWIIGESAERNTRMIQSQILPLLAKWEKESGAVFEASKTAFIHFTRNGSLQRDSNMPLCFKGDWIQPAPSIKVLGVILDQGLRFKEHLARVSAKAYKAALALKRLRGLRPSSVRQLFQATVAPVMDYASPVWYLASPNKTLKLMERAQRVAAQAIIGGFRTMAMAVAEVEAGIPSIRQRLHDQTLRFWISIHKLNRSHPHSKLAKTKGTRRFLSPLGKAAMMFRSIRAERAAPLPVVGCEPWCPKPRVYILAKDQAKEATRPGTRTIDFYTDGSVRNERAGIGIWCTSSATSFEVSAIIGRADETNVLHTELEAIWRAIRGISHERSRGFQIRVFTDSQAALQNIRKPKVNDSINLVMEIRKKIRKGTFSLHWVPAHEGIEGNERAHELAQRATENTSQLPPRALAVPISVIYAEAKKAAFKPTVDSFYGSKVGKFLKKIDKALPGKHTKKLYNCLGRMDAAILS